MNLFPDWQTLARSGYLFRIVDTGEDSAVDRVTVLLSDGDALGCDRIGGRAFSMWCENVDPMVLEEWVQSGQAVDLSSQDLSDDEKAHILRRVNDAWSEFLGEVARREAHAVAASRESAEPNDGLYTCAGKGIYAGQDGALWVHMEDAAPEDDRGPFTDPAEALAATLPDEWGLSGPEYHSPAFPEA